MVSEPKEKTTFAEKKFTFAWKVGEPYSENGWHNTLEEFEGLTGARNPRSSLSSITCGM